MNTSPVSVSDALRRRAQLSRELDLVVDALLHLSSATPKPSDYAAQTAAMNASSVEIAHQIQNVNAWIAAQPSAVPLAA